MARQQLIYETVVPVSATRHADVSVEATRDYAFSAAVNAVPLMAVEFLAAAAEFPIVFSQAGEDVIPAAVLGVGAARNLYLAGDRTWQARYVPAFIRRYPFVFAHNPDGKTLTVCIDESCPGVNREGRGERLFTHEGKPTVYVNQVLRFLREYQAHFERTRQFGKTISALGLLDPIRAQVATAEGRKIGMGGMRSVDRKKLRALAPDKLAALARTDELELLYLQMYSLRHFVSMKDRLLGRLKEDAARAPAPPPTVQ